MNTVCDNEGAACSYGPLGLNPTFLQIILSPHPPLFIRFTYLSSFHSPLVEGCSQGCLLPSASSQVESVRNLQ